LIAASALRATGSALALLSATPARISGISGLTRLAGLTAGILRSRASGCLTRQAGIQQGLKLIRNLAIIRTRSLTASSTLTTSTGIRLPQSDGCSSEG
jgi:hypothetical protein